MWRTGQLLKVYRPAALAPAAASIRVSNVFEGFRHPRSHHLAPRHPVSDCASTLNRRTAVGRSGLMLADLGSGVMEKASGVAMGSGQTKTAAKMGMPDVACLRCERTECSRRLTAGSWQRA